MEYSQILVACLLLSGVRSDNTTDTCVEPWDSGPWGAALEEWVLAAPGTSGRHGRVMTLPPTNGYYISDRVDRPPPPPPAPMGPPPASMGPVPYAEWDPHPSPTPSGPGKVVNRPPQKDKPFKPSPSYPLPPNQYQPDRPNQYQPGPSNQYQSDSPSNQYQQGPLSNQYQPGPPPNQYQPGPPSNHYQTGPPSNQYQPGPPSNQYQQGPPPNQYQPGPSQQYPGPPSHHKPPPHNKPSDPHRGPGPMPAKDRIDDPPQPQGVKQVTETDLYLLTAIEKLVYRVDLMEKRLRKMEENVHYLVAGVENKPEPCVANFTRLGATCYHFSSEPSDWKTANLACRKLRSHLVELDSEDEKRTLFSAMLADKKIRGKDIWSGGLNPGLLWIWSHSARPVVGSATTPPTSATGSGNSTAMYTVSGEGRCLALLHDPAINNYVYRGQDCSLRHRYICEKEEDKTRLSNEIEREARTLARTGPQARTLLEGALSQRLSLTSQDHTI